ncbi:MAG: hypothetical protein LBQ88_01135 [Treponema sp.]|jgi:hypothetical protein|nr:hypothetical protein [Treponema sp.]
MYIKGFRKIILGGGLVLSAFFPCLLGALDSRKTPVDMYLIVDGSLFMKETKEDAFKWLNREIIDNILQEGDSLSIWKAGDSAELIYTGYLKDNSEREKLKGLLQSFKNEDLRADFESALRDAVRRSGGKTGKRFVYTVLIGGVGSALSPDENISDGLFRYSRVEEFSGWRVLHIATGIQSQVKQAADAFMK